MRREWTEPNSLLLIRADAALHRVLPVKRGERSILKASGARLVPSSFMLALRGAVARPVSPQVGMPCFCVAFAASDVTRSRLRLQIVFTATQERLPSFLTHLASTYL